MQRLLSYRQALANYHRHPESKFLDARYADAGPTLRRHVEATAVVYIGKEANLWEEQSYVGYDTEAEITYGTTPEDRRRLLRSVKEAADTHSQRALARRPRYLCSRCPDPHGRCQPDRARHLRSCCKPPRC